MLSSRVETWCKLAVMLSSGRCFTVTHLLPKLLGFHPAGSVHSADVAQEQTLQAAQLPTDALPLW